MFFGHEPIAEAQAPEYPGVGALLAYQWPPEILTPPIPGVFEKPSKFLLSWSDLTVDEGGVRTLGTFTPTERAPRVSILGPREVSFRKALGHAKTRYTARHRDLRAPRTTQWSGDASGSEVLFTSPGQKTIRVSVSDADNLSAEDEIRVHVSVIPLEGSQQPF